MQPKQFGNYTLLERVSHGGMAEVFRAKSVGEAGFEREVALKLLLPQMASDKEFVDMLIDEAKIAGQLNHANIAQIFDLGVEGGRYFIVQEFVQGQDLRAILKRKNKTRTKLKLSSACHIAIKVCEGLHYAHNKQDPTGRPLNLVHRDISPHNILISSEGEVKIIDFGIAKAEGRSTQTMAGLVKGKFAYMSPEQIRGLPVDHRSDVFATGIVLHEMLTSRPLFQSGTEFETLKKARAAHADPPSKFNHEVPPALDAICLKALARHVDDRYQSAGELRDELWAFARANNAFAGQDQLSRMTPNAQPSEEHVQIQIASELEPDSEDIVVERVATELDPSSSAPSLGSEQPGLDEEDESTVVGAMPVDVTLEGEAYIVSEHTGPAEEHPTLADDYDDDAEGNRTVVDANIGDLASANLGLGMAEQGLSDSRPPASPNPDADFDAQWAADVGQPLAGTSSDRLPTGIPIPRPRRRIATSGEGSGEDETTTGGASELERPTKEFGVAQPMDEEQTAVGDMGSSRASTVPATPARAAAGLPVPRPARDEPSRKMALAQTEPISRELLAKAVGTDAPAAPPPAVSRNLAASSVSPADVVKGRATTSSGAVEVGSPLAPPRPNPRPSAPPPAAGMAMHGSASHSQSGPMPMPGTPMRQPGPLPMGTPGPAPVPMATPTQGNSQYGSRPVQLPHAYGMPPSPPQDFALGSPPPPSGHTITGDAPAPEFAQAMPHSYEQPQSELFVEHRTPAQSRMVFVLSAVFVLLLAAAATITLVITD